MEPHNNMSRLFLPPVNRAMRVLDRSFFRKSIPLSAMIIQDPKKITSIKNKFENELLKYNGVVAVKPVVSKRKAGGEEEIRTLEDKAKLSESDTENGRIIEKLLLLHPRIKHDDPETIPPTLQSLIESKDIRLVPYTLNLEYKNWGYDELINAILPENLLDEIPSGFTMTGHIAHINLREAYLPYKHIIAELIIDKNPKCKTVVNKIDEVGTTSEFRTFNMEILAGEHNTQVEVSENNCKFQFDFSKVYWNSRLSSEHTRIIEKFKPGEAVADVMAGVGPFAVPAAKKRVFVWANDLNPESYNAMIKNIHLNKVDNFVTPQNEDGRIFIRNSVKELYRLSKSPWGKVLIPPKVKFSLSNPIPPEKIPPPEEISVPPTFSHFVMNLPATAIEFLDAFIGVYTGMEELFEPKGKAKLPFIHVHCFQKPTDDAHDLICQRISKHLNYKIRPDDVQFTDVRLVAPNKKMYCAAFQLPREVAFAGEEGWKGIEKRPEISKMDEKAWLASIDA